MQITLDSFDVLNAAVLLEERGARFYAEASANAAGAEKNLLMKLAEMETGHARHFVNILAEIEKSSHTRKPEKEEDADDFLQALTSDRIITSECQFEKGDTYPEILEKAMLIEKNTVFFYTAVKGILQEGMSAADVDRLIGEEVGHFKMLSDALAAWRQRNKRS